MVRLADAGWMRLGFAPCRLPMEKKQHLWATRQRQNHPKSSRGHSPGIDQRARHRRVGNARLRNPLHYSTYFGGIACPCIPRTVPVPAQLARKGKGEARFLRRPAHSMHGSQDGQQVGQHGHSMWARRGGGRGLCWGGDGGLAHGSIALEKRAAGPTPSTIHHPQSTIHVPLLCS
ncbi:hypothetical protein VTK73DRAFT_3585 [Phialemonium thermophilum]|uniref:Uncharacterized protein n=1 Tax=Phialemonium thermophilum TaxID=223376 RepID=A0ABR3VHB1_9PEZI